MKKSTFQNPPPANAGTSLDREAKKNKDNIKFILPLPCQGKGLGKGFA